KAPAGDSDSSAQNGKKDAPPAATGHEKVETKSETASNGDGGTAPAPAADKGAGSSAANGDKGTGNGDQASTSKSGNGDGRAPAETGGGTSGANGGSG